MDDENRLGFSFGRFSKEKSENVPFNLSKEEQNYENILRQRYQNPNRSVNDEERRIPQLNMSQYAQQLAPWVYNYRMWMAMSSFPPFFAQQMSCLPMGNPQPFTLPNVSPNITNATQPSGHVNQVSADTTLNRLGTEFLLPPLWKRVIAELIDFVVLFYMKIIIMIVVMRQLGILKTENVLNVRLDAVTYFDFENMEMDIDKAFTLTSEIIALEIVNRIMITLFETFCLRKGIGSHGGATPGKRILGLAVVSCDNIIDLGNGRIIVSPAGDIGFINALVRSVVKNFSLSFFFPACLTVFFFQHNRAAYDILAKTVVVEQLHRARPNNQ